MIESYIEEVLERFEGKFWDSGRGIRTKDSLGDGSHVASSSEAKDFLDSSLRDLVKRIEGEVEKERWELPKGKCINLENHMLGSCFQCEKIKGFNLALDSVLALLAGKE